MQVSVFLMMRRQMAMDMLFSATKESKTGDQPYCWKVLDEEFSDIILKFIQDVLRKRKRCPEESS